MPFDLCLPPRVRSVLRFTLEDKRSATDCQHLPQLFFTSPRARPHARNLDSQPPPPGGSVANATHSHGGRRGGQYAPGGARGPGYRAIYQLALQCAPPHIKSGFACRALGWPVAAKGVFNVFNAFSILHRCRAGKPIVAREGVFNVFVAFSYPHLYLFMKELFPIPRGIRSTPP